MSYLDGMEPRLRTALELRKLSLHERGGDEWPSEVTFDVYWDDGAKHADDDRGLPVGYLRVAAYRRPGFMRRKDEFWRVSVSSPVVHEVASGLPDINEAIDVFLVHLPDRYS
ncbi:hypothetical protein RKD49_000207 [Streptomyces glaucescens]